MRTRSLGPGLGGLYYSPLLRDNNINRTAPATRLETAVQFPRDRLSGIWNAVAGAFRRAGRRLVEARMAEARERVNLAMRLYHLDRSAIGRVTPVKYY